MANINYNTSYICEGGYLLTKKLVIYINHKN